MNFEFSGERVSALVMTSVTPGILLTALLQVAEATRAASEAAKAVQQAQTKARALGPSSAASSTNVDWSKLINKRQAFDHASLEAEIKAFRDWSWQLGQFLIALDPSYNDELKKKW